VVSPTEMSSYRGDDVQWRNCCLTEKTKVVDDDVVLRLPRCSDRWHDDENVTDACAC